MFHFYTPWKRQKTKGFLTSSGGIQMEHWPKLGLRFPKTRQYFEKKAVILMMPERREKKYQEQLKTNCLFFFLAKLKLSKTSSLPLPISGKIFGKCPMLHYIQFFLSNLKIYLNEILTKQSCRIGFDFSLYFFNFAVSMY